MRGIPKQPIHTSSNAAAAPNNARADWIIKAITIACFGLAILFIIYALSSGIFQSPETFSQFMQRHRIIAPIVFILAQTIQVMIPIMPFGLGCVAGVIAFGPVMGFVYNYIGVCAGSIIAFFVARRFGTPFIERLIGQKNMQKCTQWLQKRKKSFDVMFGIAIFLPAAPDDQLCLLAGVSPMKASRFCSIILIGKPFTLILYSLGVTSVITLIQNLFH